MKSRLISLNILVSLFWQMAEEHRFTSSVFALTLAQSHSGAAAVLIDELDAGGLIEAPMVCRRTSILP
jgi:hypothetical protein